MLSPSELEAGRFFQADELLFDSRRRAFSIGRGARADMIFRAPRFAEMNSESSLDDIVSFWNFLGVVRLP